MIDAVKASEDCGKEWRPLLNSRPASVAHSALGHEPVCNAVSVIAGGNDQHQIARQRGMSFKAAREPPAPPEDRVLRRPAPTAPLSVPLRYPAPAVPA